MLSVLYGISAKAISHVDWSNILDRERNKEETRGCTSRRAHRSGVAATLVGD